MFYSMDFQGARDTRASDVPKMRSAAEVYRARRYVSRLQEVACVIDERLELTRGGAAGSATTGRGSRARDSRQSGPASVATARRLDAGPGRRSGPPLAGARW